MKQTSQPTPAKPTAQTADSAHVVKIHDPTSSLADFKMPKWAKLHSVAIGGKDVFQATPAMQDPPATTV